MPVTARFPHDGPAPTIRSGLHPLGITKFAVVMSSISMLLKLRGKRPSCNGVYIQTIFLDAGVTKVRRKQKNWLRPRIENGYENGSFVTFVQKGRNYLAEGSGLSYAQPCREPGGIISAN